MIILKNKLILLLGLLVLVNSGCTTLPPAPPQAVVNSLPPAATGAITETSDRISRDLEDDESAYLLLSRNDDALNWRLALADHATTAIDAQYFIWQKEWEFWWSESAAEKAPEEHVSLAQDRLVIWTAD
jgi:hypothetical protein